MKIYTKTGDAGDTALYGGERRSKADQRIESYGNVDELQSMLGVAAAELGEIQTEWAQALISEIETIQGDTFVICCELARTTTKPERHDPVLGKERVADLEKQIDIYDAQLEPLKNFIMQGGAKAGALLHMARTACRRAERSVVLLHTKEAVNPLVFQYLNRLSDLLFVYARFTNHQLGVPEKSWKSH